MNMPLVSIIIPYYNSENYISNSLLSYFSIEYPNCEFILVDDGSSDNSIDIVEKLISQYSNLNIHLIRLPENCGVSVARQTGLDFSSGKYIIQFDADDTVESNIVTKLVNIAELNDSDIAICGYKLISNSIITNIIPKQYVDNQDLLIDILYNKVHSSLANKLIRKSLYKQHNISWDSDINMHEDLFVMYRLVMNARNISYVQEALYNYHAYTINSATRSTDIHKHQKGVYALIEYMNHDDNLQRNKYFKHAYLSMKASVLVNVGLRYNLSSHKGYEKLFDDVKITSITTHPSLTVFQKAVAFLMVFHLYPVINLLKCIRYKHS